MREDWLHGWPRDGGIVFMGSGICCAGCGRLQGVICVVIPPDYVAPGDEPAWPFEVGDCPVCQTVTKIEPLSTAEQAAQLSWGVLREAVKIKKESGYTRKTND